MYYQFDRYWPRVAAIVTGTLLLALLTSLSVSEAQNQGRQVTLRQQLTVGLKAVTKPDLAFVDKVVKAVEMGVLPRKLVDSTFLWARDRAARKSYTRRLRPMVYFQPGLILRAKRLGVKL